LGVHIDGFISVVAHTHVVGSADAVLTADQILTRNNVISAAYTAAEVAVRLLKPGNTNTMVTQAIRQVADAYDVRPISGTLMHQMKQFVIDGNKMILLKEEPEQKVESCTFESGEVYAIDIAMSSGEGKPKETGHRTTVFKRAVDKKYSLKNKSSRSFFNDVNKKFPTLPFSVRCLPDEKAARMGIRECVTHELLLAYPVLNEKRGDFVAHVKVTVLILPSGNTAQITGLPPLTYLQAVQQQNAKESGDTTAASADIDKKLSASFPIGLTLSRVLQETKSVALPETIMELLNQTPMESKKKSKKAKKSGSAKAEEGK
jgi:curved DNA binding protein